MAHIFFLLDRSGSMNVCVDDTIGGFNTFVSNQNPDDLMTLVEFDHEYTPTYEKVPCGKVTPLNRTSYVPRGSTALFDSIGKGIKSIETNNIIFIILTDGHDNYSRKYSKAHIKDLIDAKQKDGWTFMYLGANHDAFAEGSDLGISGKNITSYNTINTRGLFTTLSAGVSQVSQNFNPKH